MQIAKASNEGLENTIQEAVFTKLSVYEPRIKTMLPLYSRDLESMKREVNYNLGSTPTTTEETNLALLASLTKDQKKFIQGLDSMLKKSDFLDMYKMLIDNAGAFYNINKKYKDIKIPEILQDAIIILSKTNTKTKDTFEDIAEELFFYLKSSNKEKIHEQRKQFDLAPNPMDEFKSNVLGITLKRYTVNNTNPSEHLFNKIQSFTDRVLEIKSGNLFENGREANSTDFVLHLYSDIADTKKIYHYY